MVPRSGGVHYARLPAFILGTVFGCFLFVMLLALFLSRWQTEGPKTLILNVGSWIFLAVGDNLVRGIEALPETLFRIGMAQLVVFLIMTGWSAATEDKERHLACARFAGEKEGASGKLRTGTPAAR